MLNVKKAGFSAISVLGFAALLSPSLGYSQVTTQSIIGGTINGNYIKLDGTNPNEITGVMVRNLSIGVGGEVRENNTDICISGMIGPRVSQVRSAQDQAGKVYDRGNSYSLDQVADQTTTVGIQFTGGAEIEIGTLERSQLNVNAGVCLTAQFNLGEQIDRLFNPSRTTPADNGTAVEPGFTLTLKNQSGTRALAFVISTYPGSQTHLGMQYRVALKK